MQLVFPPMTVTFFAGVLSFVTFDLIPYEKIYEAVFGWSNEPFSPEAEEIGYESHYFIENSGSIPIYIFCDLVLQLIFALVKLFFKKCQSVHSLASKQ